ELRGTIYEIARVKLLREAWHRGPSMDIWEVRHLTAALEKAIDHVEAFSSKQDELRALKSLDRLIETFERREVLPITACKAPPVFLYPPASGDNNPAQIFSLVFARRRPFAPPWSPRHGKLLFRFLFVAVTAIALVAAVWRFEQTSFQTGPQQPLV